MGGNSSSSSTTALTNVIFNASSQYLNENSIKVSATNNNINQISFKGAIVKGGCGLAISQKIDATTAATGVLNQDQLADFSNKIQQAASQAVQQAASASSGALALSQGNSATNVANLQTNINTTINNTIMSKSTQDIMANAKNLNIADLSGIVIDCEGEPGKGVPGVTIDQNIASSVVAQNITQNIMKAITQNDAIQQAVQKTDQTATTHSAGLDDVIKSLGDLLGGLVSAALVPYVIGCIVICCCCCCCLLLLGVFGMSAAGGSAPSA